MSLKKRAVYVVVTPSKVHVYTSHVRRERALSRAGRMFPRDTGKSLARFWGLPTRFQYPEAWDVTSCTAR